MAVYEFLGAVARALLLLTSVITLVNLARRRDRLHLGIALLFLSLTTPILTNALTSIGISVPEIVSIVSHLALISHPYILLQLVHHQHPVPVLVRNGATTGLAAVYILMLSYRDGYPEPVLIAIVLYFGMLEAYSAALLLRSARSLKGGIRTRMRLAATGAGLLSAGILTAGISFMLPLPEYAANLGVDGFAALAAVAFYVSFVPPGWLRKAWRLIELQRFIESASGTEGGDTLENSLRQLELAVSRSMGTVATSIARRIWAEDGSLTQVLSSGETLVLEDGPLAEAWEGQRPTVITDLEAVVPPIRSIARQVNARALFYAPIQATGEPWGALLAFRQDVPFFPDDDLDFLSLLVDQAESRIDQALLLADQQALVETLRKRTQELSRKERYIEEMQDPLWVLDRDNITIDLNPALGRLTGYAAEELMGHSVFEFFDEENRAILQEEFEKRARAEHSRYEIKLTTRDGESIPLIITGSPIIENNEVVGKIGVLKDIREQQAIKSRLEAANRELEAFAYSVSHDLRAPLRAINGFARILVRDHQEQLSASARHYVERIRLNAVQMGQLIDDLLALSRVGRLKLDRQLVDPTVVARDSLEDLMADLEIRSFEIVMDDLPPVSADRELLRIVFDNLIGNAIKYTRDEDPRRIEVGSELTEKGPAYFVRDNGVGFDMKYADKLFGVFQRLHRVEDYEGTGVGLATVQRIIHQHGGQIWAEGEVGQGAIFRFTLGEENEDEFSD